tara:strand:- start:357 stop:701 length:345 start_codon:yes stop_codon:yes gene_type:complete
MTTDKDPDNQRYMLPLGRLRRKLFQAELEDGIVVAAVKVLAGRWGVTEEEAMARTKGWLKDNPHPDETGQNGKVLQALEEQRSHRGEVSFTDSRPKPSEAVPKKNVAEAQWWVL